MIKHLYIIGNGFDKYHGINSSYIEFKSWMEESHSSILLDFEEAYGICDDEWWSDFENNLASLDILEYADNIADENPPDLMSDHCDSTWNDAEIYVEQELEQIYSELKSCFHEWILQLNIPLEEKILPLLIKDSFFITFNYTKTLEELYRVPSSNILHIHGCVDDDEDFIIGHGKDITQLETMNPSNDPEPPDDLNSIECQEWMQEQADSHELHVQLAENAAFRGVASQQKPVEKLILKNKDLFESLTNVEDIYVYGFSISAIDAPYLQKIYSFVKSDVPWEFSDFRNENRKRIKEFVKDNGINNYSIISLDSLKERGQLVFEFAK